MTVHRTFGDAGRSSEVTELSADFHQLMGYSLTAFS
jgi:hypothetical protein